MRGAVTHVVGDEKYYKMLQIYLNHINLIQ